MIYLSSFPADLNKVSNSDAMVSAGRSLKNLWAPQKSMAIPDQRLSLTFNRKFIRNAVGNVTVIGMLRLYY